MLHRPINPTNPVSDDLVLHLPFPPSLNNPFINVRGKGRAPVRQICSVAAAGDAGDVGTAHDRLRLSGHNLHRVRGCRTADIDTGGVSSTIWCITGSSKTICARLCGRSICVGVTSRAPS